MGYYLGVTLKFLEDFLNFAETVFYVGLAGGIGWVIAMFINAIFNKDPVNDDLTFPIFFIVGFPLGVYVAAKIFM